MKKALITRDPIPAEGNDDSGTFGKLSVVNEVFECYTLELPWRDLDADGKRDPNVSCIAPWKGEVRWTQSPSRKNLDGTREWTFRLMKVPDAEGILIHSGNFAGDKSKGYAADAQGCILLGRAIMDIEIPEHKRMAQPWIAQDRFVQKGITSSRDAVAAFVDFMGKDPFELTVK